MTEDLDTGGAQSSSPSPGPELPPENASQSPNPTDPTETTLSSTQPAETSLITTNAEGKKVRKIIRKKRRPARTQVDPATVKSEPPPQTGTIFNIWYNKWSGGDREDSYLSKTHALGRCNVKQDSGFTLADDTPGAYICLFFARGVCHRGRECPYLHRVPTMLDIYSGNVDCFGREKHQDYRDDMGGVGTFSRQNRTIYIGRISATSDIEEVVARHMAEWGPVERIRCLPARGVAFVTYKTEAYAQFAKEAMAQQSFDNDEILNVRWATVDPNPASQKREARKIEEQAAEAIRRILPPDYVKEIEGDQGAKRRRIEEGGFGLDGYRAPDEVWFQREKSRMAVEAGSKSNNGAVEASQEQFLLQAGDDVLDTEDHQVLPQKQASGAGLLGSSTLAALQGFKPNTNGATQAKESKSSSGPLVGYGSDDDSN